jgi:tetratricopeptide (TPR) repeat protein
VHAFTQESQPHDAVEKLDTLDKAIQSRESSSVDLAIDTAALFSFVCARQPRALQYCSRMLERSLKSARNNEMEARIYSELGRIYLMQGMSGLDKAMKAFREGTKKDAQNLKVLTGLILCQLCEGAYEDAESQLELLALMHNNLEDLGYETAFLQSLISKHNKKQLKKEHLDTLIKVKSMFLASKESSTSVNAAEQYILTGTKPRYLNSFQDLVSVNPDFSMLLALEFFQHIESSTVGNLIPSTNSLLNSAIQAQDEGVEPVPQSSEPTEDSSMNGEGSVAATHGIELLQHILQTCPGMISTYIELARLYFSFGKFDDAVRVLQQALALQPQAAVILIAMAFVEAGRFRTSQSNRLLEQALASDFSIRSVPKFRLVKAIIRAQQVPRRPLLLSVC